MNLDGSLRCRAVTLPVPATASDIARAEAWLLRRPFDWTRDCLADLAPRRFPALAGRGRGYPLGSRQMTRAEFARYLVESPGAARTLE
jgi:hypothetical protein